MAERQVSIECYVSISRGEPNGTPPIKEGPISMQEAVRLEDEHFGPKKRRNRILKGTGYNRLHIRYVQEVSYTSDRETVSGVEDLLESARI